MKHRDKKWTGRLRQTWNNDVRDVKVGDLVVIINENSPRESWPMGIVIDTSAGRECKKC